MLYVEDLFEKNLRLCFLLFSLVPRVNYTEICATDMDCIPTLICPIAPGMCDCPLYLPDLVCNCANGTYFDYTISQCGKSIDGTQEEENPSSSLFVSSQSIDIRWFVCHLNELYMHVDIVL